MGQIELTAEREEGGQLPTISFLVARKTSTIAAQHAGYAFEEGSPTALEETQETKDEGQRTKKILSDGQLVIVKDERAYALLGGVTIQAQWANGRYNH